MTKPGDKMIRKTNDRTLILIAAMSMVSFSLLVNCGKPQADSPKSKTITSPIGESEEQFSLEGHFESLGAESLQFAGRWIVWAEEITPSTLASVNQKAGMVEVLSMETLKFISGSVLPAGAEFTTARNKLMSAPSQENKIAAITAAQKAGAAVQSLDVSVCAKSPDALVCKKSLAEKELFTELLRPETTTAMLRTAMVLSWSKELRNVTGRFVVFDNKQSGGSESFSFCVEDLDQNSVQRYQNCVEKTGAPAHVTAKLKRESDLVKLDIKANLAEVMNGELPSSSDRNLAVKTGSFSDLDPSRFSESTVKASLEIVRTPLYRGLKGDISLIPNDGSQSVFGTVNLSEDNQLVRSAAKLAEELKQFAEAARK